MKGNIAKLKQNFLAIWIGGLLAIGLFYVIENPAFFQSNVLGIQDHKLLQSNKWEVGYKIQNNLLDVYVPQAKKYSSISFFVNFDPDQISFDLEHIEKQWTIFTDTKKEGELILTISPQEDVKKDESLFVLPYMGGNPSLVLMKVSAQKWSTEKLLVIGRLDENLVHNIADSR